MPTIPERSSPFDNVTLRSPISHVYDIYDVTMQRSWNQVLTSLKQLCLDYRKVFS